MLFNWYVKHISFPSGTGNAGLAIVPANCGCLRCYRPCFKLRVGLLEVGTSRSDLIKSSLLLLLLPAALATCDSRYSCFRSQPQNFTWGASGFQQCVKAFVCP